MVYITKGNQSHIFQTSGGTNQFIIAHTASAVNYLQVTGGPSGFGPEISAQGASANLDLYLKTKGTGSYIFYTNSAVQQFAVAHMASAVNYLEVSGNVTGNAPFMSAQGSDTNIDLSLAPKGTGNVRFGTHTGSSDVAITGYIEIKDFNGNVRKLAVIS